MSTFFSNLSALHNSCFTTNCFPQYSSNKRNFSFSLAYSRALASRNKLFQLYLDTNDPDIFKKFKTCRRAANKIALNEKRNFLQDNIQRHKNRNNPKKMWNLLRIFFKQSNSNKVGPVEYNDSVLSSDYEIACGFNKYFTEIIYSNLIDHFGSIPSVISFDFSSLRDSPDCFCFSLVSSDVVLRIFSHLKPSSVDCDFITLNVFQLSPDYI